MSENVLLTVRRVFLTSGAALLVLLLGFGGWFFTRPVTPGEFVIRVVPAGSTPGAFVLNLRGPGGEGLGEWRFQDVPSPAVLAGLQKKVPWKAVSTQANPQRPCLTLQAPASVSGEVLAPLERFLLSQCCPGVTDAARCPIRRVFLER